MNVEKFKSPVVLFVVKALVIFTVWYVTYELWLLPDGRLDEWLALNIVGVSNGIVRFLGYDSWAIHRIIGIAENPGIELVDGCTGISAIGLFLGFILAYPGKWTKRISFSIMGIGVIYIVNILRIVILTITQEEWPAFFEFTHDYSTTIIFYIVIFLMWMLWANISDGTFATTNSPSDADA